MKFMCIIHHDEPRLAAMSAAEVEDLVRDCIVWIGELEKEGRHVMSMGLQCARTATWLRRAAGKVETTDGPFSEAKECVGGFTIFEARDHAEAVTLASRFPPMRVGRVELRPILDPDGEVPEALDKKLAAAMQAQSRGVNPDLASRVGIVSKANL